ncbi:hypothetical protein COV82_03055 [Candidatus Peregrinibacteria bacterium CG11_big_fil_rev_8_21_14_0_20_46_8]|nr:MAG: hypothetical protein COV82_03055 [Candidatus Peregrinibacteria bacterium CG11_big_fil_rev_8_21_14_0_20_46_8]
MEKRVPWKVMDLWRVVGATALLYFLSSIALIAVFDEDPFANGDVAGTFFIFIVQELIFLLPVYSLIIRRYRTKPADFGFVNIGWKKTLEYVLKGFGLFLLFIIAMAIVTNTIPFDIPGFAEQEAHLPWFGDGLLGTIIAIFTLVILAPVVEEFLFRGFLLQTLITKYKPWLASILTAMIFAGLHLEFSSFGIIFILALIINWIFIRSRSIWPGMIFHVLNNSFALLVEFFLR